MDILTYALCKKYIEARISDIPGVTIDEVLSSTSNNAIANAAVAKAIEELNTSIETLEAEIRSIEGGMPPVTSADSGRYLRVSADGVWEVSGIKTIGDITQD